MYKKDLKEIIIDGVKKSLQIKNISLILLIGVIIWGLTVVILTADYIDLSAESFTSVASRATVQLFVLASFFAGFAGLFFLSIIIKNVSGDTFKDNFISAARKFPTIVVSAIIIIFIILSINYIFSNIAQGIAQTTVSEDTTNKYLPPNILSESREQVVLINMLSIFSFFVPGDNIASIFAMVIIGLLMLFVFQEILIRDKSIKNAFKGSAHLFVHNYIWQAVILVIFTIIVIPSLYILNLILSYFLVIPSSIIFFVLPYILLTTWLSFLEIILLTELYLKVKE